MVRLEAVALALAATFMTVAASAAPDHGTAQHLEQRQEDAKQELTQLYLEYAKTAQTMMELMEKLAAGK
ncbi:hypothetical protein J3459_013561 [Metarhizium acridum]|nr:hypothetical protein J3459_013561 [Metarhizium acridum]